MRLSTEGNHTTIHIRVRIHNDENKVARILETRVGVIYTVILRP